MKVGYGSIYPSELESDLETQLALLKAAGCVTLLDDEASETGPRHGLDEAISICKANDCLMVHTLDRLARSGSEMLRLFELLTLKSVNLEILDFGGAALSSISTHPSIVRQIVMALFDFEHATHLRRQRSGIARAKNNKKYKGRHPSARLQREEIWTRIVQKHQTAAAVAIELKISVPSVYRMVREVEVERRQSRITALKNSATSGRHQPIPHSDETKESED